MNGRKRIAVTWIEDTGIGYVAGKMAVNPARLAVMLDVDDGRSAQAQQKAVYRFLARNNIKPVRGARVFPLARVKQAIDERSANEE